MVKQKDRKEELCLTEKDILILKEYHRACADKRKTILLISEGFMYPEIEKYYCWSKERLFPNETRFTKG
jgi:hypothetical protein